MNHPKSKPLDAAELRRNTEAELKKSREYLNQIINCIGDPIFVKDRQHRFVLSNDSNCSMVGMPREEIIGRTLQDTLPKEIMGPLIEREEQIFETGKPSVSVEELQDIRGQRYIAMANKTLLTDANGQKQIVGVIRDITELKRAEKALQAISSRQEAILAAVPDIIMEVDNHKIYVWANQAGLDFFGDDVIGSEAAFYFKGEQATYKLVQPIFDGRQEDVIYIESWQRRRDGEKRLLAWWCRVLKDERGNATGAMSSARDITERKQAEAELLHEKTFTDKLLNSPRDTVFLFDPATGKPIRWNDCFERVSGYSHEEIVAMKAPDDFYDKDELAADGIVANILTKGEGKKELALITKLGARIPFEYVVSSVTTAEGKTLLLSMGRDVTERKRAEEEKAKLEAQLHQAQKMESVGRLAGGVAHDFNNMLGVIIGHTELALDQLDPSQPLYDDLTEIQKAANRSANLTRQLLAFARKQTVAPRVLDLNQTITSMLNMLQKLIGEDINLNWHPIEKLWSVKIDPSQIDQILANLCVNARDAITGVGKITIGIENCTLDDDFCAANKGAVPGEHVRLTVSDNGCGMDKGTLANIFEPFFTTKGIGKGTGLGLATIYGIVKQNNGYIKVYSEPGHGSTFSIYLARYVDNTEQATGTEAAVQRAKHGHETILLVEDELSLLKSIKTMLEKQGYTVLAASTPGEALCLAKEHGSEIHLLMTDVVMPGMNGRDLAENLLLLCPHLKQLFTSGYTADVITKQGVLGEGVYFIQKPFTSQSLATKIREVLGKA